MAKKTKNEIVAVFAIALTTFAFGIVVGGMLPFKACVISAIGSSIALAGAVIAFFNAMNRK